MQEVSGVYTSPFLHSDERKMALRDRKVSSAFEKRALETEVWLMESHGTAINVLRINRQKLKKQQTSQRTSEFQLKKD